MKNILIITKKELASFFQTPIAYIFLMAYVVLSSVFTFYIGNFFEKGQAGMQSFFQFQPWIFLLFISAITMRMWSEEKKTGTIELLLTLPFKELDLIVGKFLGAFLFVLISMVFTIPIWISVNILGNPDNSVIIASYLGNLLIASAFISIGLCLSSFTKNQIVSFIISIMIFFIYLLGGTNVVLDFFNQNLPMLADTISSISVLGHFENFTRGAVEIKSIVFFLLTIIFWTAINYYSIRYNKA